MAVGFVKSLTLSVTGIIDCAVVGRFLGADGLSALKLALPVFALLALFSTILSTGQSVAVARELAGGRRENAEFTVQTVFTVSVLIAAVFMLVGAFCPSAVTRLFAGDDLDPGVFSAATDYLMPILLAALPILLYDVFGTIVLLEGANRYLHIVWRRSLQWMSSGICWLCVLKPGCSG